MQKTNLANRLPECSGIIPARYQSKRFPGKPLALIAGKPMFWHVYDRARRCPHLKQIFLATDDHRILEAARALDVPVLFTRSDHPSGSDRVMEAAEQLALGADSVVVNIQGDEPLIEPGMLTDLLLPFADPGAGVTTLAHPLAAEDLENPDRVKVVCSLSGRALYFSRQCIPGRSGGSRTALGHIGLYAFRLSLLKQFVSWGPSPLERAERLEQLRLLEHDVPIQVVTTAYRSRSVDRIQDLEDIARQMENA